MKPRERDKLPNLKAGAYRFDFYYCTTKYQVDGVSLDIPFEDTGFRVAISYG